MVMSEQMKTGFGASVPRKEDRRFITGQGRYTDDLKLPGQAYAYFVRSPYAHARILDIDLSAAREAPGVIGILTGEDYEASGLGPLINGWDTRSRDGTPAVMAHRGALTKSEVKFAGEAVAVVIAESRVAAKDASELVMVDYEDLPVVTSAVAALEEGALQLHDIAPGNLVFDWDTGDAEAVDIAFAGAAHTISLALNNSRLIPNAMEPRAANAVYDPGTGEFTLHLTTRSGSCPVTSAAALAQKRRSTLKKLSVCLPRNNSAGPSNGRPNAARPFSPMPMPGIMPPPSSWHWMRITNSRHCASTPLPTWARISRRLAHWCLPSCTR
jgi:CO/xanthine dehydrogenase Mo-binding subunit